MRSTRSTSIVQDVWPKGQELAIDGWINALADGPIRDLEVGVTGPAVIGRVRMPDILCGSSVKTGRDRWRSRGIAASRRTRAMVLEPRVWFLVCSRQPAICASVLAPEVEFAIASWSMIPQVLRVPR